MNECRHPTSFQCAKCNITHCMECKELTVTNDVKTAVRWCRTCDPYNLGPQGKLEVVDALMVTPVISIQKAQGTGPYPVRGAIVEIVGEFRHVDLNESRRQSERQALLLAQTLRNTLPQCTLDRLIAELLRMKASSLVLKMPELDNG